MIDDDGIKSEMGTLLIIKTGHKAITRKISQAFAAQPIALRQTGRDGELDVLYRQTKVASINLKPQTRIQSGCASHVPAQGLPMSPVRTAGRAPVLTTAGGVVHCFFR
jgi:hypothetical protein